MSPFRLHIFIDPSSISSEFNAINIINVILCLHKAESVVIATAVES